MIQNNSYQQEDQYVNNIVSKVLSKRTIPMKIKNNSHDTSKQAASVFQNKQPIQGQFKSNLFTIIAENNAQNYNLQVQNKELRIAYAKISEKLKKFQHRKRKQQQKHKEIQVLTSQLNTIIQAHQSIESQLNSLRLSRHQISSNTITLFQSKTVDQSTRKLANRINKQSNDTKKNNLSSCCCHKERKYKKMIRQLKRESERKQFLTDSNKTKNMVQNSLVRKSQGKPEIYIENQYNLASSFKTQQLQTQFLVNASMQVQQGQLYISQAEQYKSSIKQRIKGQIQYIKSLQCIIVQQQKVLTDYEKRIKQAPKRNKSRDAGKFVKNKSKSQLQTNKTSQIYNSGGKILNVQSLARFKVITDRLNSCPSTGIILRKQQSGRLK